MDNYPQWQQLKSYEGHIKRLRFIGKKSSSQEKPKSSRQRTLLNQSLTAKKDNDSQIKLSSLQEEKIRMMVKYKTEPSLRKPNTLRMPIPLVSEDEGLLIKETLNSKSMSMREKEQLLENYLLSRRILETKSVIKPLEIKRSFRFHQKISANLSKSRSANKYSQERSQSFRNYEKERKEENRIQVGEGRNYLDLKVLQILLIKGIIAKNPATLYNLDVQVRGHKYKIHSLSYNNLFNKTMRIRFKKSLLTSTPEVSFYLSMVRENCEIEMGVFKVGLAGLDHLGKQGLWKIVKGGFPVGTLRAHAAVHHFTNPPD